MTKLRHILVTGAAGFIGSNFARIALENNYCVTGLDSLTYAGQRSTIDHLKRCDKFRFCHDDIGNKDLISSVVSNGHQAELCVINLPPTMSIVLLKVQNCFTKPMCLAPII